MQINAAWGLIWLAAQDFELSKVKIHEKSETSIGGRLRLGLKS